MRVLPVVWFCLFSCSAPPIPPVMPARQPERRVTPVPDPAPVDPIAALAPDDGSELSWVIPGPIQLELGASPVASAGSGRPIEVGTIDHEGNLERVAVRLEHARFSVWINRSHLLSVLRRDQRVEAFSSATPGSDVEVVLRAGATVRRLGHRDRLTHIRYLGALEVEGWVPDGALSDQGRARDGTGRIPSGRKTLMVIPGAVIRSQPRWTASALAVVANGYFLDSIRELDDVWTEISYEDGDVGVHGFVSKSDPPGHVHHWQEPDVSATVTPSATAPSGTCLYARPGGDEIGYVVGNRAVDLEEGSAGWWTLSIDTPWGPLAFAARGSTATDLVACAPAGSVPPVTPPPPPSIP